jgi:hypothetical protein
VGGGAGSSTQNPILFRFQLHTIISHVISAFRSLTLPMSPPLCPSPVHLHVLSTMVLLCTIVSWVCSHLTTTTLAS